MIGAKDFYEEIQSEIQGRIEAYVNGETGILDTVTALNDSKKALENSIEQIKEFENLYANEIECQAREYDGSYNGYKIEVKQGRKTFDYSKIEDVKIAEENVKELKDYYKKAFEAHQKNILMADYDGAEISLPELRIGKPSVIIKKQD